MKNNKINNDYKAKYLFIITSPIPVMLNMAIQVVGVSSVGFNRVFRWNLFYVD